MQCHVNSWLFVVCAPMKSGFPALGYAISERKNLRRNCKDNNNNQLDNDPLCLFEGFRDYGAIFNLGEN